MNRINLSLKKKLFSLFTMFAVFPVICIAVILSFIVNGSLDNMVHENVKQTSSIVKEYLDQQTAEINAISKRYSDNQEILTFFVNKDRVRMEWKVKPVYSALKDEKNITFFEYIDENGIVFTKGQEPGIYGEDYSQNPSVQLALQGETVSGFEFNDDTYMIVSYEPVSSYEKVIGVLRIGYSIDQTFLKKMKSMLSSNIDFFYENNPILSSDTESQTLGNLDDDKWETLSQTLSLGEATFETTNQGKVDIFYPISSINQNQVQGFIRITRDLSNIFNIQHSIFIISVIIVIVSLIITVILSTLLSKNITNPIYQLIGFMTKISQGDLTTKINIGQRQDEIGQLANRSTEMVIQLKQLIYQIQQMTKQVVDSSTLLFSNAEQTTEALGLTVQSIDEIAKGAYRQMKGSEDTARSLEEMAIGIQKIAGNTNTVATTSNSMHDKAQTGNKSAQKAIKQIRSIDQAVNELSTFVVDLNKQSTEIENIIGVITNIANQTNLLALNAAIEAARAGEHGKGFAVVAEEVRKLSVQVNDSIQQIASLIKSIQEDADGSVGAMTEVTNEVKLGIQLIEDAGQAFQNILEASRYTSNQIIEVSTASQEMSANSEEVTAAMEQISLIATESTATSKQVAVSSQEQIESLIEIKESAKGLHDLVDQLENLIHKFTI